MIIILFLAMIIFIFIGIVSSKVLLNPITIYNSIWLLVISLYQLRLSKLQDILSSKGIVLLLVPILSFNLIYYCVDLLRYLIKNSHTKIKQEKKIQQKFFTSRTIWRYFLFWIIVEIIEIIYSRGLPILWKLTGSPKTYFDFGIPTLHGFMNALGLVIVMLAFYYLRVINPKSNKMKIIIVTMLMLYLSMITRQVIISAIIQMLIIYIVCLKKIKWKKVFLLGILVIISFGILGNIRTGYDEFLNVALIETDINRSLIGIYWVYMYLTMTVANVNSIANMVFEHMGLYPIVSMYLPSIIRNIFFEVREVPNYLVTQAFNVSGYYIDFYIGLGYWGVAFIGGLYGYIGSYLFNKVRNVTNSKYIIYYAVYIQIISLSFFYNHLLYLPSGFQFIIIYLLYRMLNRKKKVNILNLEE